MIELAKKKIVTDAEPRGSQTSIRFKPSVIKKLKHACIERNLSQQAAIELAVEEWVGMPESLSIEQRGLVNAFTRFIQEEDPLTIQERTRFIKDREAKREKPHATKEEAAQKSSGRDKGKLSA